MQAFRKKLRLTFRL